MGHVSLYRKYRPLNWEQIVGQNHIVRTIKNQISSNNISHAYLFTGSRGTGKTSSAKIFARAINCLNPINGSPCNKCANCMSILNETSFDVVELDAASNNSVNDIRSLIENISIPPMNGKYKVYIVDEVHMLSQQAFNAFLKTLEEPPEYVVFILATTEVHKIPNTILSRCMQFDFRLIPVNELTEIVTKIFDNEHYKYEIEACRQIAIYGEGSARDTLSIADMCMAYSPTNLTYNDVLEVLGGSDFETLYIIAESILNANISRLLEHIDTIYHRGKGISTLNRELANFFKELITIKNVPSYAPFSNEQNQIALNLAREHDNYKISRILEIITSIESNLRFSTQPKILFEANLIKASELITSPNVEALNSRMETLEKQIDAFSKDNVEYFKKFLNNNNLIPSLYSTDKDFSILKKKNNLKTTNQSEANDDKSATNNPKIANQLDANYDNDKSITNNLNTIKTLDINHNNDKSVTNDLKRTNTLGTNHDDSKDSEIKHDKNIKSLENTIKKPSKTKGKETPSSLPFENEQTNSVDFDSELPFENGKTTDDGDFNSELLVEINENISNDDFDSELPFENGETTDDSNFNAELPVEDNENISNDDFDSELPFENGETTDNSNFNAELPVEDNENISNDDFDSELPFGVNENISNDDFDSELPFENGETTDNSNFNAELPVEDNENISNDDFDSELPFENGETTYDDSVNSKLPFEIEEINNGELEDLEVDEELNKADVEIDKKSSNDIANVNTEKSFDEYSLNNVIDINADEEEEDLESDEENIEDLTTENNENFLPFEEQENNNEGKELFDALLDAYKDNVFIIRALKQADKFELKNGILTLKYMEINALSYKRLQNQYKDELNKTIKTISPNTKIEFKLMEAQEDGKLNQLEIEEIEKLFGPNLIIKE